MIDLTFSFLLSMFEESPKIFVQVQKQTQKVYLPGGFAVMSVAEWVGIFQYLVWRMCMAAPSGAVNVPIHSNLQPPGRDQEALFPSTIPTKILNKQTRVFALCSIKTWPSETRPYHEFYAVKISSLQLMVLKRAIYFVASQC